MGAESLGWSNSENKNHTLSDLSVLITFLMNEYSSIWRKSDATNWIKDKGKTDSIFFLIEFLVFGAFIALFYEEITVQLSSSVVLNTKKIGIF